MNSLTPSSNSPLVALKDGKPVTTSLIVAEVFDKRHDNVLRDISNILSSQVYRQRGVLNFEETPYVNLQNGQTYRIYEMDRQGFEILAMGFTGEKALAWKFKYSDAFAAMEAELKTVLAVQPQMHSLLVRALRALDLIRDAFVRQLLVNQIKAICARLNLEMPNLALVGKPADQMQLEV